MQNMNSQAAAVLDVIEKFSTDRRIIGIGCDLVEYEFPASDREVDEWNTNRTIVDFHYVTDQTRFGRYEKAELVIPGYVSYACVARGIYEFATRHGIRHGITGEGLVKILNPDLFALLIERTS